VVNKIPPYAICRISVAFTWIYHGLFPKLLGPHSDEIAMNMSLGFSQSRAATVSIWAGLAEIIFGIIIVTLWKSRWPMRLTAFAMIGLLLFSIVAKPELAVAAFNPVTTNLCVFALAVVGYQLQGDSSVS
jgi:hypothetical protein